jgi:hypothetical protein
VENQVKGPGVIDVYGDGGWKSLVDHVQDVLDGYYPSGVLQLGDNDAMVTFRDEMKKDSLSEKGVGRLKSKHGEEKEGHGEIPFSLASEGQAKELVDHVRAFPGQVKVECKTLLWFHPNQTDQTFLPAFLKLTRGLTVYVVNGRQLNEDGQWMNGWVKRPLDSEGEEIAEGIEFNPKDNEVGIPTMPETAMYGKAEKLARSLKSPLGFAYPAILACAAGSGIKQMESTRPTLNVALLGGAGDSKSIACARAVALFFQDPEGSQVGSQDLAEIYHRLVISRTPGSDQGLYRVLEEAKGEPRLLVLDEMRNLMCKGNIENSSLMSVLCELYYRNKAGGTDKKNDWKVDVRLSMLGCVKIASPAEFPEVFGFATAQGFYDRTIFGVDPEDSFRWSRWSIPPFAFEPSEPFMPEEFDEAMENWKSQNKKFRKRLGELILRVALVSAAINQDKVVSHECFRAATEFMEWQEKVRGFYQPAKGTNDHQEAVLTIEEALMKVGGAASWRHLTLKNNWFRLPWYRQLIPARKTMLENGDLAFDRNEKVYRLTRPIKKEK